METHHGPGRRRQRKQTDKTIPNADSGMKKKNITRGDELPPKDPN
jgi:hypothetical protein